MGDLLPGFIGSTGKYSTTKLTKSIDFYNSNFAGQLTPAGSVLANAGLITGDQLVKLGAYSPFICSNLRPLGQPCQPLPGHYAQATWLKTIDLRLAWPFQIGERVRFEPNVSVFNVFNFANFAGAGNQLIKRCPQRRARHFAE